MCDSCGFFSEISDSVLRSDFAEDLTSDLSCIGLPNITGMVIFTKDVPGLQRNGSDSTCFEDLLTRNHCIHMTMTLNST